MSVLAGSTAGPSSAWASRKNSFSGFPTTWARTSAENSGAVFSTTLDQACYCTVNVKIRLCTRQPVFRTSVVDPDLYQMIRTQIKQKVVMHQKFEIFVLQ